MPTRNRIVLGRYQDARVGASLTRTAGSAFNHASVHGDCSTEMHNLVEIVRHHLGNGYALVAYAHFHRRKWSKTRLKKSTFYKRLKKVKKLLLTVNTERNRCRSLRQ